MADNVQITQGLGTTIATEEVGGVHHQKFVAETLDGSGNPSPVAAATPMPVRVGDGTTQVPILTADADAESNTASKFPVVSWLKAFNGTTWDRIRSGLVGVQTTFTGILNSITMGRYNATPPTLADGNIAPLQLDSSGNLKSVISNAAGSGVYIRPGTSAVFTVQQLTSADLKCTEVNSESIKDDVTDILTNTTTIETNLINLEGNFELVLAQAGAAITPPVFGVVGVGTDGSNYRAIKTDSNGELQIDVLTLPALPAGNANIGDVDVASLPALATGDNTVGRVKLTDGTDVADILDLPNSNPLAVAMVDGSGNQITSFGGGTQYTEGDTDSTITGTAMLWEDTSDTLRAVSASKPLPVNIVSGAGSGGTAQTDKSTFTEGTTNFTPVGGVFNETISADPTEDQAAAARITAKRAIHTNLRTAAGAELLGQQNMAGSIPVVLASNQSSIPVTGTFWQATQPVSGTVTANAGTGPWPVTDNGGSLTVDGTVTANLSGTTNAGATAKTADFDSGAGTDTVTMFGVALPKSGGAVAGGTSSDPFRVDPTGTTPQPITDNGGSITVDGTVTANLGTLGGAATEAKQDTIIGHVDGIETLIGTSNTNTGNIATSVQLIDDAIVADDAAFTPATTKVMMAGFEFDDTSPDSVNEGDAGAARMSANRNIYTQIRDAAGNERGANVNASNQLSVSVDNTAGVNLAQVAGTTTATGNGTASAGCQRVTIASDNTAITVNATTTGNVASDAADSGNPVKIGGLARSSDITAVANADRVDFIADLNGRQVVAPYALPENLISGKTSDITGTGDTAVIATQGVGIRSYITNILVTNSHATVGTWVNIKDGTTTIYTGYAAAAGGGFSVPLPAPLRLTANTALNVACETSGANVRASASGYKGP